MLIHSIMLQQGSGIDVGVVIGTALVLLFLGLIWYGNRSSVIARYQNDPSPEDSAGPTADPEAGVDRAGTPIDQVQVQRTRKQNPPSGRGQGRGKG